MPTAVERLKNKLNERLNWDTFVKEVGQGMETLPIPMTVLTPGTLGKFATEFASNKALMNKFYKNLPPNIRDAWAFIKTRYPSTFNKIDELKTHFNPFQEMEGGAYYSTSPKTGVVEITPQGRQVKDYIETMGHEIGHNVVQRRWPKIYFSPEVEQNYRLSRILQESKPRGGNSYYAEQLKKQLKNITDIIYNDPNELIPDQIGKTVKKSYNKFLEMTK